MMHRVLAVVVALVALGASVGARAQDTANGEALYRSFCASCHFIPVGVGADRAANDPARLRAAISAGVPEMAFLRFLTDPQLADIAAWIALSVGTPAPPPVIEPTGFWSGVGESGWGLNFNLQGDSLLGAVYSYDTDGSPLWLVLSVGSRSGNAYTGPLYRSTGPVFSASPWVWNPGTNLQRVGDMTVTFTSSNAGSLTYTFNGVTVNKSISKFTFGSPVTTCTQTAGSRAGLTNYQDVWEAAPAGSEPGWGLAVAQEGGVISAGLYTYGSNGKTLWLLLSPGIRQADGSFSGNLYSPRGPAFNTTPWPSGSVVIGNPVGTMTLRFTNGDTGTLSYSVNGVTVNKNITRNVFGSTRPACQ